MIIHYYEGELDGEIKNEKAVHHLDNLYVRIGEKIELGSTLCEIVDIVHRFSASGSVHSVNVYVKVIKKLPETKSILDMIFKR